jgi:hypothetical protein
MEYSYFSSNSSCDMDSEDDSSMSLSTFASQDSSSGLSPPAPVRTAEEIPHDAESWHKICICKLSNGKCMLYFDLHSIYRKEKNVVLCAKKFGEKYLH